MHSLGLSTGLIKTLILAFVSRVYVWLWMSLQQSVWRGINLVKSLQLPGGGDGSRGQR